jgi:hypothetical protein
MEGEAKGEEGKAEAQRMTTLRTPFFLFIFHVFAYLVIILNASNIDRHKRREKLRLGAVMIEILAKARYYALQIMIYSLCIVKMKARLVYWPG